MANNFCSNCGTKLAEGAKFCKNCGTKVATAETPQIPVEKPREANTTKLAVPANYKKGILSLKGCTLVFTDSELIVAITDKKIMNEHIASVREESSGQGFFKKTAAVMKSGYTFTDRYYSMTADAIKSETPDNFTLPFNIIESLRYKRSVTNYGVDNTTTSSTPPSLVIKTTGGKLSFTFSSGYRERELIALLNGTFPGRYKGPKR
ncbi:MAG: zinc-ribbon domain-containing protein [Clostridia bacterium]|nr:zinc-ribbon domain-containing protein [Clostridia bacterium]MBN2884052.1 zinc-ribbon domain-containing protein [Clostridia bacterium]